LTSSLLFIFSFGFLLRLFDLLSSFILSLFSFDGLNLLFFTISLNIDNYSITILIDSNSISSSLLLIYS